VPEVQTGLWHWQAVHPEWKSEANWDQMVSSYAIDNGDRLLLFDPLALPGEIEELVSDRETAIVLTCPWHRRDAVGLGERLGVPIYVPPPDPPDPNPVDGNVFSAGDRLPVGVEAFAGAEPNDLVLWVESQRALVVGDTIIATAQGLDLPDWASLGVPREQILEPLLELPVEHVLPTHGLPTDRVALERALS
jgi:glyoxylase-like metal-dependent hydrolase (beta-lactamase superfamily II)